jgi:hypothetical protein
MACAPGLHLGGVLRSSRSPRRPVARIVGIGRGPASPVRDWSIPQEGRENLNPCIGSPHQYRNRRNPGRIDAPTTSSWPHICVRSTDCDAHGDVASASLLEAWIDEAERCTWSRSAANCMVLQPACHVDPVNFYNLHGFYPDNLRRK